jgi:two-component system response regulator HydG
MKRILVVDDDEAILTLLNEALPTLGFEADFALSGGNAIELLRSKHYDLILSDIRMPEVNGIEVAQVAMQSTPYTPILFMSGNPNVRVEEQSFLPKPFTISELEVKLTYLLDSSATDDFM